MSFRKSIAENDAGRDALLAKMLSGAMRVLTATNFVEAEHERETHLRLQMRRG